jgi:hypothetical protein
MILVETPLPRAQLMVLLQLRPSYEAEGFLSFSEYARPTYRRSPRDAATGNAHSERNSTLASQNVAYAAQQIAGIADHMDHGGMRLYSAGWPWSIFPGASLPSPVRPDDRGRGHRRVPRASEPGPNYSFVCIGQ